MADGIKGTPINSTAVYVNEYDVVCYLVNGKPTNRDDFNALNLARIAAAVEVLAEDAEDDDDDEDMHDDEPDEGGTPPTTPSGGIFGLGR